MKKQLKLFFIALTILFNVFSFSNTTLFPTANATYVEGPITQDTVWTLVDSPFVVSKDVIIYPNATLTIEPGVEVRSGRNFSLTVEGRLVANGTSDKMIKFTSNNDEPEAGDWGAITFNGMQLSSLVYCTIEYGTNGITVENGVLNIQNSLVRFNSENGIMITNGNVELKNNEIANNIMGGIYIAGGNKVTVQDNIVRSTGDGITLEGNLTSEININQNKIVSNIHGVYLKASAYDKTIILNNTISGNSYGFYVSTNASTFITRNYIFANTNGIFYGDGKNHKAYFNDIYDNTVGMDVSPEATVNATYNYWGDRSGPYHKSLNPHGKGNLVGGNGINLDFIFFLTSSINYEYNNIRPSAILWTDKTLVAINQTVTFIGTDSHDEGRVDQYFFDFGDETNSSWTTLSLFTHQYSSFGTYNAFLKVRDDFGAENVSKFTTIQVENLPALEVSLALSNDTVDRNGEVSITVYVSSNGNSVENANVTLFSVKGGSFTPLSGLTNSTGYFTARFTAPTVTEIIDVRIIARASKTDYTENYADGSDYKYLKVLPPLVVQIVAEPSMVKSEAASTITVAVTFNAVPISNVTVKVSSDSGNFLTTTETTDLDGRTTFFFIAPQTKEMLNALITATATKTGYVSGEGQIIITVIHKILEVQVTAEPIVTVSEAKINVTVHVSYEMNPVLDANVTITSESGEFSTPFGLTDSYGNRAFIFTASQTNEQTNIAITAKATKIGYADGENQLNIIVDRGILNVQVTANSTFLMSRQSTVVTVYVARNATPVANAEVTLSSTYGNFSATTGVTDSNGRCEFNFSAPQTTAQLSVVVKANATKNGYVSGENQTTITVTPEIIETGGGWPVITILLIIVLVAIVIIAVVVLIKLKIISVYVKEEEGS